MVFLFVALSVLLCFVSSQKELKSLNRLTFRRPFVGHTGKNISYSFNGNYLVVTGAGDDHTQLGYQSPHTAGFIQTHEPIRYSSFKVEVVFEMLARTGGAGVGFWLSDKLSSGDLYGRNRGYAGTGVFIDTSSAPKISVMDSSLGVRHKPINVTFEKGTAKLVLEKSEDRLKVVLRQGSTDVSVYDGECSASKECYFGISAAAGNSVNIMKIYSISGYSLPKTKKHRNKEESKKNGWLVFLVAAAGIAGLAYYLYTKQSKEFAMKN